MYKNFEAECARKGINKQGIAELLGISYGTALAKSNGNSSFTLDEAMKIKSNLFPDMTIDYLFEKA